MNASTTLQFADVLLDELVLDVVGVVVDAEGAAHVPAPSHPVGLAHAVASPEGAPSAFLFDAPE
jgi:hypothetical protein